MDPKVETVSDLIDYLSQFSGETLVRVKYDGMVEAVRPTRSYLSSDEDGEYFCDKPDRLAVVTVVF